MRLFPPAAGRRWTTRNEQAGSLRRSPRPDYASASISSRITDEGSPSRSSSGESEPEAIFWRVPDRRSSAHNSADRIVGEACGPPMRRTEGNAVKDQDRLPRHQGSGADKTLDRIAGGVEGR